MGGGLTNKGAILPAPIGGVDLKNSPVTMEPIYAMWLENFFADTKYCKVRNGMANFASLSISDQAQIIAVYPGATDTIFALTYDTATLNYKAYDITAGGVVAPNTIINYFGGTTWFSSFYNKHLFIFESGTPAGGIGAKYNGAAWSAIGYTYVDANFAPCGAAVYKGRHYLIDRLTLKYEYSTVGGVSGATLSEVDLSSYFSRGGTFAWVAKFNTQDGITNSSYLAFGSTTGEVLIYSGDYPNSTNWSIVGQYRIAPPAAVWPNAFNLVLEFQTDALIITSAGLVSLRRLLTEGYGAMVNTVSSNIDVLWNKVAKTAATGTAAIWGGIYWPDQNKIIIYNNYYFTSSDRNPQNTRGMFYVLNTITGAWSFYSAPLAVLKNVNQLIYANKKIYMNNTALQKVVYEFEKAGTWRDYDGSSDAQYDFNLLSNWNAYQTQIANQKINALQPIINTDFVVSNGGIYGMEVAKDFESSVTDLEYYDNLPAGFSKNAYSVGQEGTFMQYIISGGTPTTATTGFEFYSVNVSYEEGINTL